jgi:hypothetical protein
MSDRRTANLKWIASQGIVLSNYFAITHPSQPNYVASVGGDTHGVSGDGFFASPHLCRVLLICLKLKGSAGANRRRTYRIVASKAITPTRGRELMTMFGSISEFLQCV